MLRSGSPGLVEAICGVGLHDLMVSAGLRVTLQRRQPYHHRTSSAYNEHFVPEPRDLNVVAEWMRLDWNGRAQQDAEHFVYTRDAEVDEADFSASGRANYDQL